MADRPIWRGQLRLALVSCPIALYSVRQPSESLHFHFINPATGHRVRMVTQDAETDEELSRRDLVRGYEFKKDHYVLLNDEDFERARIDSSSVLVIDKFVGREDIDPVYYDSSYYVLPDGQGRDAAEDVYAVLRAAFEKTGRAALSRLVIARRERAVALMPMGDGLILHTLNDAREIADADAVFADLDRQAPQQDMVKLAVQLIDRQTRPFDLSDMEDRYEARLREVIEAKVKGEDLALPEEEEEESNVVDLMAALRKSLGEDAPKAASGKAAPARKKAPAKGAAKPATTASKTAAPKRKKAG